MLKSPMIYIFHHSFSVLKYYIFVYGATSKSSPDTRLSRGAQWNVSMGSQQCYRTEFPTPDAQN